MNGVIEWVIFIALSGVAVFCAAGMILTMSMYRAGLALMASFVALAGLFILLDADLLAAIQIMMNVGGMLVMVLFMVMMMMDPGGEMMWGMKRDMHMPGPGAFSMHMPRGKPPEDEPEQDTSAQSTNWTCPMHPEVNQSSSGNCPKCGMALIPRAESGDGHEDENSTKQAASFTCPMHPEVQQNQPGNCPKCGMQLMPANDTAQSHVTDGHQGMAMGDMHSDAMTMPHDMQMDGDSNRPMQMDMQDTDMKSGEQGMSLPHEGHATAQATNGMNGMDMSGSDKNMSGMTPKQNFQMMVDMAMSTSQLPWAIALGVASALLLCVLVVKTPWPLAQAGPTQDATTAVGELLLSRYMIGFEGSAFLILAGIAGAVIFAKRERNNKAQPPEQEQTAKEDTANHTDAKQQLYTCPMHPEIRQTQSGSCPKCSMQLIPIEEKVALSRESQQGGHT